MSSIACLRIAVGQGLAAGDAEALAGVVARIAGAYLETTWLWPRRFGLVAPFAFVLADPRARRLDARELQALAASLQAKLFGTKGVGEVCLLMLEGEQTEVMRFAGTPVEELRLLLAGEDDGAFAGRIRRITPTGVTSIAPTNGPIDGAPSAEERAVVPLEPAPRPAVGWRGLYSLAEERFAGWALTHSSPRGDFAAERDDPFALERDLEGLKTVGAAAEATGEGLLFAGFAYSGLVRPSVRAALRPALEAMPARLRSRLAATLRQAPREPSYGVLSEILRLLGPRFATLNLQVADPEFRIDCIPADSVGSVTLGLAGSDARVRLKAIRRFMAGRAAYFANRVRQDVANVKTPAELELCRAMGVRHVSGPAVSELMRAPAGPAGVALHALPHPAGRRRAPRQSAGEPRLVP
jgi:hypothetical protein